MKDKGRTSILSGVLATFLLGAVIFGVLACTAGGGPLPFEEGEEATPTFEPTYTPESTFTPEPTPGLSADEEFMLLCRSEVERLLGLSPGAAYVGTVNGWCMSKFGPVISPWKDYKEAATEFIAKYERGLIPLEQFMVSFKFSREMPSSLIPIEMQEDLRLSLLNSLPSQEVLGLSRLSIDVWGYASDEIIYVRMLPNLREGVLTYMPEGFRCANEMRQEPLPNKFSIEAVDSVSGRSRVWSPICTSFSEMINLLQWREEYSSLELELTLSTEEWNSIGALLVTAEKDFLSINMTAEEVTAIRTRKVYLETVVIPDLSQKLGSLQQKITLIESAYNFVEGKVPFRDFISTKYEGWVAIQRAKLGGDVWKFQERVSGFHTRTLPGCGYFVGSGDARSFNVESVLQLGGKAVALAGTFVVSGSPNSLWTYFVTLTLPTIPENPSLAWLLELLGIMEHPNCS